MKTPKDMTPGLRYTTKHCGELEIIEYSSWDSVVVRFLDTNTVTKTRASKIREGSVKDKNIRTIHGVGFVGYGDYTGGTGTPGKGSADYRCWYRMLDRCYGERSLHEKPTYRGVTVCEEWHNFQNFARWYEENYPKDGLSYELDKDIKSCGTRIYSPSTCLFVTHKINAQKASALNYKMISPSGDVFYIYNMKDFCKGKNLLHARMCEVHRGVIAEYKGWKKAD